MACDKRPAQVCESDPAQDIRIRSDITRVIVADELRVKHGHIDQQGDEGEPQANKRRLPKPLDAKLPEDRFFPRVLLHPNEVYFLCPRAASVLPGASYRG